MVRVHTDPLFFCNDSATPEIYPDLTHSFPTRRSSDLAPYAYYLVALCYYEQLADVTRDQKITQQALDALGELIRRYPDTRYAADARLKLDLVNDHLAGKEMEIGRFYQRRGQWLADRKNVV